MASLDKEIKVVMMRGLTGNSSYQDAVENELFSGTLEEWIETFATPENYITRTEFQKVTQAQYDELKAQGQLIPNAFYLITDDDTYDEITTRIDNLYSSVGDLVASVDDINNDISDINDDISDLNGDVTDINTDIGDIRTGLGVITSNIDTINERLDELGFEEGSFDLASTITANVNSIKKQGKYVIAKLGAVGQTVDMTDGLYIEPKFRPKEDTTINAEIIVMVNGIPTYYTTCKVSTNGLITYENGNAITNCVALTIQSAGWEIN